MFRVTSKRRYGGNSLVDKYRNVCFSCRFFESYWTFCLPCLLQFSGLRKASARSEKCVLWRAAASVLHGSSWCCSCVDNEAYGALFFCCFFLFFFVLFQQLQHLPYQRSSNCSGLFCASSSSFSCEHFLLLSSATETAAAEPNSSESPHWPSVPAAHHVRDGLIDGACNVLVPWPSSSSPRPRPPRVPL